MDNFPQNLIDQYLKTSNKLKKFDRVVFKRFAPNVSEILEDFARIAKRFEEADIFQYAAMCHLGVAKCERFSGNTVNECQAYLRAARAFLRADHDTECLHLRSNFGECKEGALRCYTIALERCPDDVVLKAAIIREMTPLQPHYESTSSFTSPAHRIYELELAAHSCIERRDFLAALQNLDDIVDNIYERKQQFLYEEQLQRIEILRILLLVALDLPTNNSQQSPSHIKMIDYYCRMGNFEDVEEPVSPSAGSSTSINGSSISMYIPGAYLQLEMKYALAEIVVAWTERNANHLKLALEDFSSEFSSLNEAQRFVLNHILDEIRKKC